MKIKELPKNDMPYEKLENFGERSLTESELLAIIIRNGNKNNNSIQIAQKILGEEHLKFRDIFYKSLEELIAYPGIGKVKAIQIKAIGEIIRRVEIPLKSKREKISSTKDVGEKYMPKLRYLKIEEMYVIFLDAKNNILKDKKIGNSSISSVDIDIEEIIRTAIITYCARMVVVHNHPSGDTTPSIEDLQFTERLKYILETLGIELLDHVIIGDGEYRSIINMI